MGITKGGGGGGGGAKAAPYLKEVDMIDRVLVLHGPVDLHVLDHDVVRPQIDPGELGIDLAGRDLLSADLLPLWQHLSWHAELVHILFPSVMLHPK